MLNKKWKKGDGSIKFGYRDNILEGGCNNLLSLHYWE